MDRRLRHLMVQSLEKFEDTFPDLEESKEGQLFKNDLKNAFNDAMRAQRDEIRDYDVEYRPLKIDSNNILYITQTFLQTIQNIRFGFTNISDEPMVEIMAALSHIKVIDALRSEIEAGIILRSDNMCTLCVVGLEDCVNKILPIMDKYTLHNKVRKQYLDWKQEIIEIYKT